MSRTRGPIRHSDPFVRSFLEAINASGFKDYYIAETAKIHLSEFSAWRRGVRTPSLTRVLRVLKIIGAEVVIQQPNRAELRKAA